MTFYILIGSVLALQVELEIWAASLQTVARYLWSQRSIPIWLRWTVDKIM